MHDTKTLAIMGLVAGAATKEIEKLTKLRSLGYDQQLASSVLASVPDHPKRILDLACGVGTAAIHLSTLFRSVVVGIDISNMLLAEAKRRAREAQQGTRVLLVQADLRSNIPVKPDWPDLIVASSIGDALGSKFRSFEMLRNAFPATSSLLWLESMAWPIGRHELSHQKYRRTILSTAQNAGWRPGAHVEYTREGLQLNPDMPERSVTGYTMATMYIKSH